MPYSLRQHSKAGLFVFSGMDQKFLPDDFVFRSSRLPHKRESFSRSDASVSRLARRLKGKREGWTLAKSGCEIGEWIGAADYTNDMTSMKLWKREGNCVDMNQGNLLCCI